MSQGIIKAVFSPLDNKNIPKTCRNEGSFEVRKPTVSVSVPSHQKILNLSKCFKVHNVLNFSYDYLFPFVLLQCKENGAAKGQHSCFSQRNSAGHSSEKHVAFRQSSIDESPQSIRSPLQRQRRIVCYDDDDASEEDDFVKKEESHFCDTKKKNGDEDSGIVMTTPSLDVDEEVPPDELPRSILGEAGTSLCGSSVESEDSSVEHIVDSPFIAIKSFEYTTRPENHPSTLGIKDPQEGQSESKRSPKLEHKAVTRVKSMLSNENPNASKHKNEDNRSSAKASKTTPVVKKSEGVEILGRCNTETVELLCSEYESVGLDLEIKQSPVKVIITGIRPQGETGKVRPNLFTCFSVCSVETVSNPFDYYPNDKKD